MNEISTLQKKKVEESTLALLSLLPFGEHSPLVVVAKMYNLGTEQDTSLVDILIFDFQLPEP
jgi:hypothetical protein